LTRSIANVRIESRTKTVVVRPVSSAPPIRAVSPNRPSANFCCRSRATRTPRVVGIEFRKIPNLKALPR